MGVNQSNYSLLFLLCEKKQYAGSGCDRPNIASFMVCHSLTVLGVGRWARGLWTLGSREGGAREGKVKGGGKSLGGVMGGRREGGENRTSRGKKTNESSRGDAMGTWSEHT